MIGRSPWTSESQENYVNYQQHCIDVNPDVLNKIENYIEERLPQREKDERRSPQRPQKSKEKQEKKENKYQSNNYLSPKAASSKQIPLQQDLASPKNYRPASIADANKSTKKIKIVDDGKMEGVQKAENKPYSQALEKTKNSEHELTQNDQAKLIENVQYSLFSSSRPRDGSPTVHSRPISESRLFRTMEEGTLTQSMED